MTALKAPKMGELIGISIYKNLSVEGRKKPQFEDSVFGHFTINWKRELSVNCLHVVKQYIYKKVLH